MDDNNIEKPIRIDHETFYDGRVYGETKSRYVYWLVEYPKKFSSIC